MSEALSERVMSQLRLAVLSDCNCHITVADAAKDARTAGLSGAEIDAALTQRSFDIRTSAVLDYGCALKRGDLSLCAKAHQHALHCGLSAEELDCVKSFVCRELSERP